MKINSFKDLYIFFREINFTNVFLVYSIMPSTIYTSVYVWFCVLGYGNHWNFRPWRFYNIFEKIFQYDLWPASHWCIFRFVLGSQKKYVIFKKFWINILINSFFFSGAVNALRTHGPNGFSMQLKFRNYDQSNQCSGMRDSSVSYAAASFTMG